MFIKNPSTKSRLWAGLSYLGPMFILIPLIRKQDDEFVRYHLKQGIVLIFAVILIVPIGGIVVGIIMTVLNEIGQIILEIVAIISFIIIWFVYIFIGMLNCQRGQKKPLPIIGKFAEKITL